MEFKDAVKYLRSELGLTQVELATGLHMNAITVGRWENGKTIPSRSISALLLDYARVKGASRECLALLTQAISDAARSRLVFADEGRHAADRASYRPLIDAAAFPILVCDRETDEILYLNGKAGELIGADASAVGRTCYQCLMLRDTPCEFCHKTELTEDAYLNYDICCALDGETYHAQGKLVQWGGRRAYVKCLLGKVGLPEEAFPGVGETAAKLGTVFEQINGGVSVAVYEDGGAVRLAYANDRYYRLFGYTKEQFTEELNDPYDTVHPDDRAKAAEAIRKVKETRQAATFRYRIIKRDKSLAYVRCSTSVAVVDGINGFVMISILTDITASVQMEQRAAVSGRQLNAIIKSMDSAVTVSRAHQDGTVEILFSNDLHHDMLGYTKEQYRAEVADPLQLVYPDDADAVRAAIFSLHCVGEEKEMQYRIFARDGALKTVRMHISMIEYPDADEPVQLAVHTDVTRIVEAQRQIASQRDQIAGLLHDTPSGIAIVEVDPRDIAGTLHTTFYNDRFFSFSGYNRDEYSALLKENEMALVFDEDVTTLLGDVRILCSGEIGTSADSLVRCHKKDGGFRWLLLTGQLVQRREETCVINIAVIDVTARQEAVDRQRINEEMLRIAAETDKRTMIVYDVKHNTCRAESQALFSTEYGEIIENIPQPLIDRGIVAQSSVEELRAMFACICDGQKEIRASLQLRSGPDKYEWFECNASTVFDREGRPDHAVLVFHNITEQRIKEAVFKKWQQSIRSRAPESFTLFRCNLSKDASLDERDGTLLKIEFPSDAMSFDSRTKQYVEACVFPADRDAYSALLNTDTLLTMFYRGEHAATLDYRELTDSGEGVWRRLTVETVEDPNSADVQAFLMYEDIDQSKRADIAAKELAESDPLTGALNRGAFADKVDRIISENPLAHYAMIMLDMDGFKQLNDTFGHAVGDQALQEVTSVLRSFAGNDGLVCRLGGDEFVVCLRDIPYDAVIAKTAQQICEHIRKAYSQEVLLSASAGISVYPRDGRSYDELYLSADKALYKMKQSGKGSYAFFSEIGEEQTEALVKAVSAVKPSVQSPRTVKRRMLIVDDNKMSRVTLKNAFQEEFLIETAKNGSEAMIRLRHFGAAISVVLLDLHMPVIDGFSVLRRMRNDMDLRTIPVVVVTEDGEHATLLKVFELGAAEFVAKPVDVDLIRMRVKAVVSKADNERLRAQNSYLMLQRDEEMKYRTVLESTGTVVVEYDWRNHVFIYDGEISKHIAGNYDHRGLWQVFLSDMVAGSADVKGLQDALIHLARDRNKRRDSRLIMLKTPGGVKHWFRTNLYKSVDDFGLAEKLIVTFNDVHDEVLANDKLLFQATRDALTGLYNRVGFLDKAAEMIADREPGYYVMSCIDIERFKVINDQYGPEKGDEILCKFARNLEKLHQDSNGICCRIMADNFAILYPTRLIGSHELEASHNAVVHIDDTVPVLQIAVGRCIVDDKTMDVSAVYDRAAIAKSTVKGRYDANIATFDESMRTAILRQQEITGQMNHALDSGQFEVWLQPQVNHATGKLSGAEALVRWRHPVEGIIPPAEFIPIFERNGFVYELDKYVWTQTCALLRKWLDQGLSPVPVSINISRYDVFRSDLIRVIDRLIARYALPRDLLRLEITESAFTQSSEQIIQVVSTLVEKGYTVEIDDFGSGYSSLNTLKDVPAQVLKMDMRFLENDRNAQRGGSIVESVVRMAKWLGMAVIAEGVETIEQADYLRSIGCNYIQGYLYSRPAQISDYERLFATGQTEPKLQIMSAAETWNNNAFWNPASMETLIFNSYVGGACIFEYCGGKAEILRRNEQYIRELHGLIPENAELQDVSIVPFLDAKSREELIGTLQQALETDREASCEMRLTKGEQTEYVRQTSRVIARAAERTLYYCVIQNLTGQRRLERERAESAERLSIIMSNVNGGVSAIEIDDDGTSRLVFHNDKYYELYGYTRAEEGEQELDPMRFIISEDFPGVMEKVKKLKADGQPVTIDYGIIKKDGSYAQIRANASLMTMEGYGPIITSVLTDVTEQRTLEEQLRAVVDNINGGVTATYMHDGELRFVLSNDKYYEMLGFTKEQYAAEVRSVFQLIHPEDRERVEQLYTQAVQAGTPYTMEYRIVCRDGSVRHILCNANIIHVFGLKESIQLSVFNDVTLLRETQQKEQSLTRQMQTILQNIRGGVTATVLHKDGQLEIIFANDGYYELFGYTKEQLGSEKPNILDIIVPEDREKTMDTLTRIVREHGSGTYEYRCRKRDASIVWMQTVNTVISLPGVADTVLLAVTTDISELRHAEEQRLEAADRLSAVMNAMTNGMTAVAFHDKQMEFLFANDRFYQMHGVKKEDCSPEWFLDTMRLLHPDDRKRVSALTMQTTRVGQSNAIEYRVISPDGTLRWIKALITVTHLIGVDMPVQVAVYTDITDEKKTREQIRFLNASAAAILAQPNSEKAIRDTLQTLLDYFAGERTYIFELDDAARASDNTFECCAPGVTPEIDRLKSVSYDTQQYWFDAFDKTGFVVISDVAAIKEESQLAMREVLLSQDIRSIIVAPLWRDGRLIGYIGVDNPTKAVDQVSQLIALSDFFAVLLTRRDLVSAVEQERQTVQQLMDDTPGGFLRMELFEDRNPVIVAVNDGLCNMLGMTRDEVLGAYGDNVYACLSDKDAASAPAEIARASVSGRQYTNTCRLRKKDGGLRWVMLFGRFVQGEAGKRYLNAYFTDITEQRSVNQLQSDLLDNLPFGAAMYEFDGRSLTAIHLNRRYSEMVNRTVDTSVAGFSPTEAIHPDDRQLALDEIRAAIAQRRNAACDIRLLYGEGEYRLFHLDARIVRGEDGRYLLYVAYERITDRELELKETSERLKLLSDSIPGGIATFRCTRKSIEPIYYNDGVCTLAGYSREEYDRSRVSVLDLIFDEDRHIIGKQIELLLKGETTLDCFVRIHTKSGGYKWVECMASVTGREHDDVFLVSAVLTDVTEHQEERERLRVSEELNRLAIDQSGKIIARYDVAARTLTLPYSLPDIFVLPKVLENMPEEQVRLGRISPDTADAYCSVFARVHSGEASGEVVYQQNSTVGWRWLKSQFTTVFASDDRPVSAVITFEDITEQREKEAIYTRWQNTMAERNPDSYTLVRCNLNKSSIMDSWEGALLRIRFTDPMQPFNSRTAEYAERFVHADDQLAFCSFLNSDTMLAEYHRGHRNDSIDYREQNEDGSVRWLRLTVDLVEYPDSTDVEAYLLFENIDEQKHAELTAIRRAETDPLTGVLNRVTFSQRVNQIISRHGRQTQHALFVLDIDGFKQVNDVFGHGAGDQALTDVANTLTHFCRKDDLVGRLGGDEFFVFLPGIGSAKTAERKARQICDLTRKSISADVRISISIGIALYPQDGNGFETLYKAADEALYRTKNAGKDGYAFDFGDPVIGADAGQYVEPPAWGTAEDTQKRISHRILIVNGSASEQAALETILKDAYFVEKAGDAATALGMLHHYGSAISVVLLDMPVPGTDGLAMLERMQQDERTCMIPVIAVSADETGQTALHVIRAGASDLIAKPVDAETLRIRVRSAVSKSDREHLRAQNRYLSIGNTEVSSYRAALERTGTMVITLDWGSGAFFYSPAVSQRLAGRYDARPFWDILLFDQVADEQTARSIRKLVESIVNDKQRTEGSLTVRLKTRSEDPRLFEMNVFKERDDYGLVTKLMLTLREAPQD